MFAGARGWKGSPFPSHAIRVGLLELRELGSVGLLVLVAVFSLYGDTRLPSTLLLFSLHGLIVSVCEGSGWWLLWFVACGIWLCLWGTVLDSSILGREYLVISVHGEGRLSPGKVEGLQRVISLRPMQSE